MKRLIPVLLFAALFGGTRAGAHHSFAAQYFEDQTVSIEGKVVGFDYISPHAWVYVMAPDGHGTMQRFGAEWSNPRRLQRQEITASTLQVGDFVVIFGSPGRDPENFEMHLKSIERPTDGWRWVTSRNRGRRR